MNKTSVNQVANSAMCTKTHDRAVAKRRDLAAHETSSVLRLELCLSLAQSSQDPFCNQSQCYTLNVSKHSLATNEESRYRPQKWLSDHFGVTWKSIKSYFMAQLTKYMAGAHLLTNRFSSKQNKKNKKKKQRTIFRSRKTNFNGFQQEKWCLMQLQTY